MELLPKPFPATILRALTRLYPKLESLEIRSHPTLVPEVSCLSVSTPCLRRLTLRFVTLRYLSSVLSSATGLVELSLTLVVVYGTQPEVSLIANLQRMSYLRGLELNFDYSSANTAPISSPPPASAVDVGPLSHPYDI